MGNSGRALSRDHPALGRLNPSWDCVLLLPVRVAKVQARMAVVSVVFAALALAGACGGAIQADGSDASTDLGTPPVPYDATAALEAGGQMGNSSSSSPGSGQGVGLNNPSGGSNTMFGSCPSSCSSNWDCASCPLPPGSNSKSCCVMGICAMLATCPAIRDSGVDVRMDAGADSSVIDAADGGLPDADGCACTPLYLSCRAQGFCGCCHQAVCSGAGVCIPITN